MGAITKRLRTYYLFARPSFSEGIARVLDLGGTLNVYNEHESQQQADARATNNDWLTVGDDMRVALNQYDRGQVKGGQLA